MIAGRAIICLQADTVGGTPAHAELVRVRSVTSSKGSSPHPNMCRPKLKVDSFPRTAKGSFNGHTRPTRAFRRLVSVVVMVSAVITVIERGFNLYGVDAMSVKSARQSRIPDRISTTLRQHSGPVGHNRRSDSCCIPSAPGYENSTQSLRSHSICQVSPARIVGSDKRTPFATQRKSDCRPATTGTAIGPFSVQCGLF